MNIEVAKPDLENALAVAGITVGSGNGISAHYLFRIKSDDDGDISVEVLSKDIMSFSGAPLKCNVDGADGDAFTVEAWRLNKWVQGVGDGVLKLSYNGEGDVHAAGPRSKVRFRSLDPSKFPLQDKLLASGEMVGTVDPKAISRALSLARFFVSVDDTSKPELCQIESVKGVLWATDRRALFSAQVPTLPELGIRIPGKEVAAVLKFLDNKQTQDDTIEIRQAERSAEDGGGANATFVRPDGSYVGVTRPTSTFPNLNIDREAVDEVTMTLDREEFEAAVAVLLAGAPKGHEAVTFEYSEEGGVSMSMSSEAGGVDKYPLTLAKVVNGEKFDTPFTVDYPYIKGIAKTFGMDSIEFGVNKRNRGGFISFRHRDDETDKSNEYYSVIVWRT
jgi:hypothetical protein